MTNSLARATNATIRNTGDSYTFIKALIFSSHAKQNIDYLCTDILNIRSSAISARPINLAMEDLHSEVLQVITNHEIIQYNDRCSYLQNHMVNDRRSWLAARFTTGISACYNFDMKIAIGSDHAGYQLKEVVRDFLKDNHIEFKDFGVDAPNPVDYPDIGVQVADAVSNGEFDRGILICGSGIGMSITANKVPGIRAALCTDSYCGRLSREHNDANVLVLGDRVIGHGVAVDIVQTWLSTDFSGNERHANRIRKIADIEKRYNGRGQS